MAMPSRPVQCTEVESPHIALRGKRIRLRVVNVGCAEYSEFIALKKADYLIMKSAGWVHHEHTW